MVLLIALLLENHLLDKKKRKDSFYTLNFNFSHQMYNVTSKGLQNLWNASLLLDKYGLKLHFLYCCRSLPIDQIKAIQTMFQSHFFPQMLQF